MDKISLNKDWAEWTAAPTCIHLAPEQKILHFKSSFPQAVTLCAILGFLCDSNSKLMPGTLTACIPS